jgi:hypothetical protein
MPLFWEFQKQLFRGFCLDYYLRWHFSRHFYRQIMNRNKFHAALALVASALVSVLIIRWLVRWLF